MQFGSTIASPFGYKQPQARGNSHRRCAGPFIEDLLAERGITVTRESIRLWGIKFGALYARRLKRNQHGYGDTFYIDEVFVKINGKQHYLWRAVDQEGLPHERSECFGYGEVVDVFLQAARDGAAAKRFFKRLLRSHGGEPRKIVTDTLRSYGVAHRELIPNAFHDNTLYANNRAEQSQETRGSRQLGCESGVCGGPTSRGSNRSGRLSDSWAPMQLCRIYSTWVGIWSVPSTIGISG